MALTETLLIAGTRQAFVASAAASQGSTNSYASALEVDTAPYRSLTITIKVTTQSVDWEVFGANLSDFTDEVSVQAEATVAAAGKSSYTASLPPVWRYYRVKIKSTAPDTPGTAALTAYAKV